MDLFRKVDPTQLQIPVHVEDDLSGSSNRIACPYSYVISNFALQGKDATLLSPVVAAAAMTAATLVVVRTMLIFISIEATVAVTIPPVRKAVSLSRLVEMILLKGVIWTPPPIAAKPNGLVAPLPLRIRRGMRGG